MENGSTTSGKKPRCEAFLAWMGSPSFYIYTNYVLGAWGDWMWQFAVGLYLVKLSGGLLRLAAIYGFCGGCCVLLFGGLVGDWVDRNPRLKVMVTTLFIQNLSVMLSSMAVCLTLIHASWIDNTLDGGMRLICEGVIVIMAICAQVSSVGYKIAIEKDWIVVIAAGNQAVLANLNAVTRAIDLSCKILAPTAVGLIMTYGSDELAAIVIAVWNLVSVFVEFALLRKVYSMVPALAVKRADQNVDDNDADAQDACVSLNPQVDEGKSRDPVVSTSQEEAAQPLRAERQDAMVGANQQESAQPLREKSQEKKDKAKKTCVERMFDPFITLVRGWKTYARQRVVYAGLSLAFLYMTVLGFDSITTGYIYANGVKEYLVAISMGLAGFTGIIGTVCFTFSRKKFGLERTGLYSYSAEILCLSLCVASVFTPGSPFQPLSGHYRKYDLLSCRHSNESDRAFGNVSTESPRVKREAYGLSSMRNRLDADFTHPHAAMSDSDAAVVRISTISHGNLLSVYHKYGSINSNRQHSSDDVAEISILPNQFHVIRKRQADNSTDFPYTVNSTDFLPNTVTTDSSDSTNQTEQHEREGRESSACVEDKHLLSYLSIALFLIGIVTSRVGLWMADLVVTQLIQENVIESERGVVNGVQNSLNMLMDMLKFTLVIFVPHIRHFGYLILASFLFICMAGCLFAFHSWRVRGHLFHCDKLCGQRSDVAHSSTKETVEIHGQLKRGQVAV